MNTANIMRYALCGGGLGGCGKTIEKQSFKPEKNATNNRDKKKYNLKKSIDFDIVESE